MKYYYCLCSLFLLVVVVIIRSTQGQQLHSKSDCWTAADTTFGAVEIRFPFRLRNQSESCGYQGFELYYQNNSILLKLPHDPQPLVVRYISFASQQLSVSDPDGCLFTSLLKLNLSASPFRFPTEINQCNYLACRSTYRHDILNKYYYHNYNNYYYYYYHDCCGHRDPFYIPIECSSQASAGDEGQSYFNLTNCTTNLSQGFYYLVNSRFTPIDFTSHKCDVMASSKFIISSNGQEFLLGWDWPDCRDCSGNCSFNTRSNKTECIVSPPTFYRRTTYLGSDAKHPTVGVYLAVAVVVAAVIILVPVLWKLRKMQKNMQNAKIETFLKEYKSTKPTRYSLSELKKMTNNFKTKLGQGGYGSVCKGKLPNGVPVAVKVLDNPTMSGEEFTNEMGTLGRIHHVSIVRLLGFCVEGSTRALIYEFMPNESLDKHIIKGDKRDASVFSWVKLLDIATSIAEGIEYLHQGCDQRILHLDIKPQNILLDEDFNPKISDFGLAKLCSKEKSAVSVTAVRGTTGYIAPEVLLGSSKTVSHKSDVYSFGMLLLEMIGGSKDRDSDDNEAQIYFPEWVYSQLEQGEELRIAASSVEEIEVARKLAIISLWCVQWRPADRPSMKHVVLMLKESLESLALPPNPFASQFGENNMKYAQVVIDEDNDVNADDDNTETGYSRGIQSHNDQIV